MPSFKSLEKEYRDLYDSVRFKGSKVQAINNAAAKALRHKAEYCEVAEQTNIPWEFIAAIHMRESNADFRGVLHNGQRIIGTGRKTTLVPKGAGPFDTWSEAAIDALTRQKLANKPDGYWTIERKLYHLEQFNGWGYRGRGKSKRSPYLWGGTNHQLRGKYVADGKYSSTAMDVQLGAVPVMIRIQDLDAKPKTIVKASRRVGFVHYFARFFEWAGVGGFLSLTMLERVSSFLTDWRTIALFVLFAIFYITLKYLKWVSIREYREGRYLPSKDVRTEETETGKRI